MRIEVSLPKQQAAVMLSLLLTSLAAFAQPPASQVVSRFAGTWVEDQSKRKTGAMRSLTFRKGENGLEELRGSYANPLVQPVRFDTAPYAVDSSKNTLVWKQLGGGRFERTFAENGKTVSVRRITISAEGKALTEMIETNLADGKKSTQTIVYTRTSGSGQTLEGVWKPKSIKSDTPAKLSIEAVGGTLKILLQTGQTYTLTFDGKPNVVTGPGVISGTTSAGRIVTDNVIEDARARLGTPTDTLTLTLAADGKTLTASLMRLGPDASKEPNVVVYSKQ